MNLSEALLTSSEKFRTSRRIGGVVTALVTNNEDPEKLGRVKLTFPWLSTDGETHWVRIATMMAGTGRGTVFLPEVGDEVLVAFEHGNVDYPYVIGALWSLKDRPPYGNDDGRNDTRMIESRNGHRVVFEDRNTRRDQIRIETNGGHSLVLDDSAGSQEIEITTDGGHTIHLGDSDGRVRIQDRNGNTYESSGGHLQIRGSGTITIRASTIRIRGNTIEIDASGVLTLKGGIVRIN